MATSAELGPRNGQFFKTAMIGLLQTASRAIDCNLRSVALLCLEFGVSANCVLVRQDNGGDITALGDLIKCLVSRENQTTGMQNCDQAFGHVDESLRGGIVVHRGRQHI